MPHPLVTQLRFTRSEFQRTLIDLNDADARHRLLPMNCISWNVGHLAWHEQRYFLWYGLGQLPFPRLNEQFASGGPANTPALDEVLTVWKAIQEAADPWLDALTIEKLQQPVVIRGQPSEYIFGSLLQRVIYHYWYHAGENMAIRQMLKHTDLQEFVGDLDVEAPYRPD